MNVLDVVCAQSQCSNPKSSTFAQIFYRFIVFSSERNSKHTAKTCRANASVRKRDGPCWGQRATQRLRLRLLPRRPFVLRANFSISTISALPATARVGIIAQRSLYNSNNTASTDATRTSYTCAAQAAPTAIAFVPDTRPNTTAEAQTNRENLGVLPGFGLLLLYLSPSLKNQLPVLLDGFPVLLSLGGQAPHLRYNEVRRLSEERRKARNCQSAREKAKESEIVPYHASESAALSHPFLPLLLV